MKRTFLFFLFVIFLAGCVVKLQLGKGTGAGSGVLIEPVGKDISIVAVNAEPGDSMIGAYWFLTDTYGHNVLLGAGLSGMYVVHQIEASPDKKHLAVVSSGEGHPILEIMDLAALIEKKEVKTLFAINPYPGAIEIITWDRDNLIVESEMLLSLPDPLNDNQPPPCIIFDKPQLFSIHSPDWKISAISPKAKHPKKFIQNIAAGGDNYESQCAARALELLNEAP